MAKPQRAHSDEPQQATADWFRSEFEKDLQFFQLFLLLINKSCAIKRIDLIWAQDGPAGSAGLRQKLVSTGEALAGPCARMLSGGPIFEPVFCNRIEDCAISDKEAEKRVRRSRKGEAYRCRAGLIDIAVPVFAAGQHIATLFTGQVRREPATDAGLVQLERRLGSADLDLESVRDSWWQVPVVSDADIQSALEILGVFAEYLGNTWTRLTEAVRSEQRRGRELHLARKEFAHLALEGGMATHAPLLELIRVLGFKRHPNRVLVVKLESEEEHGPPAGSLDLALTRAVQAVEDLCESMSNTACVYLRNRGICVFFHDGVEAPEYRARTLAGRILRAISRATDLNARIGIGSAKANWHRLTESYEEATVALASGAAPIACFSISSQPVDELAASVGQVCRCLAEVRLPDARTALAALPLRVSQTLGDLPSQRHFYAFALESLAYTASGLLPRDAAEEHARVGTLLAGAGDAFELRDTFVRQAEAIVDMIRRGWLGKREKVVERASHLIYRELANPDAAASVSPPRIAARVGLSPGHLSRTFKRVSGMTLERYLMTARVELSKRLLLEPANTVAWVSEQLGFSDATYFARVFRTIAGCSPSEYRENPGLSPNRRLALEPPRALDASATLLGGHSLR